MAGFMQLNSWLNQANIYALGSTLYFGSLPA